MFRLLANWALVSAGMILRNANARVKVGDDVLLNKCSKGKPSVLENSKVCQRTIGSATGVYDLMYEVKTQ